MKKDIVCATCGFMERMKLGWLGDVALFSAALIGIVSFVIWPLFLLWPLLFVILGGYALAYVACDNCSMSGRDGSHSRFI